MRLKVYDKLDNFHISKVHSECIPIDTLFQSMFSYGDVFEKQVILV